MHCEVGHKAVIVNESVLVTETGYLARCQLCGICHFVYRLGL